MVENTPAGRVAVYEGMFIFEANRFARDHDGLPNTITKLIESLDGTIEVSRLWEERRMAYPIRGHRKGAYWITYFHLPTSKVGELTRQCEINDGILRQLFVRLPEKLVDTILSHAKGEVVAEPETDDPTPVEPVKESPAEASAT